MSSECHFVERLEVSAWILITSACVYSGKQMVQPNDSCNELD